MAVTWETQIAKWNDGTKEQRPQEAVTIQEALGTVQRLQETSTIVRMESATQTSPEATTRLELSLAKTQASVNGQGAPGGSPRRRRIEPGEDDGHRLPAIHEQIEQLAQRRLESFHFDDDGYDIVNSNRFLGGPGQFHPRARISRAFSQYR